MSRIEDTRGRDPLIHLTGMLGGPSQYIEEMEAAGQRQLVKSTVLPIEGPWDALRDLGFEAGEKTDDLFCEATLPAGWTKEGSDHAMWSYVLDERGVRRVAVFYKAAYYDRRADFHIENVGRSFSTTALYGDDDPTLPVEWSLLTADEQASFVESVREYLRQCDEYPDIYGKRRARAEALLTLSTTGGGS